MESIAVILNNMQTVMTTNWKVLHWYEDADVLLLFNLAEDIGETKSVAKQHPKLYKKMFDQMMQLLPIPLLKNHAVS